MTALPPDMTLDAIRREIDAIDDAILDLLVRRFAATGRVKATKASDGSIASSPFRPAREAAMLRRLVGRGGASVPPETLVRLWRVILSASTLSQAPVNIHMDRSLGADLASRLAIGQHFFGMSVEVHGSTADALDALATRRGDLAVLATDSAWADRFCATPAGGAGLIGVLPLLESGGAPKLLVFGHAEPQASGEDETLVVSSEKPPGSARMRWQSRSGAWWLTGLDGFLQPGDPILLDVLRQLPGARIAGRYPRPIKA